jgi:adenylate cyclase
LPSETSYNFVRALKKPLKNKYLMAILLSLGALGIVLLLGLVFPQSFEEWEEKSLDYRFRLRKSVSVYPYITTIGIDDGSLDKIGTWPWDRSVHARMIRLLTSFGVSSIDMDIFFPRPSQNPDGDQQLFQAVQEAGNVILAAPFELIDHPCFTQQEYKEFLEKFPHVEKIVHSLVTQKDDGICIDFNNQLIDEQWNEIGDEAGRELLRHEEFVFTGEGDREKFEEFLRTFRYPFTMQQKGKVWYANRALLPLKELIQVTSGVGHATATPDSDGVFRRIPLVIRVKDRLIPHLALTAVLQYLQVKPEDVTIVPGKYIILHNARYPEKSLPQDIKIPVDNRLQFRVNYPSWKIHSFSDILEAETNPEWKDFWKKELEGHICVIGYVSSGTGDIGPNPVETNFPLALIHSAIMNTILSQNFLYDTGKGLNIGITLSLLLFIAIISLTLPPLHFTFVVFSTIAGYIGLTVFLFIKYGIILKLVNPVVAASVLAYTLSIVYWYATEERERKQLRSAFKTYVSKQMLTKILNNPKSLALQGQRKEVTILFSDIKAFSTLSDRVEPELIHRLLNLYFSRMTNVVFKYDGFVDKFIGDGMLCFFGDPIFHPDHALRAVRSAIDMQREVRALGSEIQEKFDLNPIVIRIGINTGYVIVGNMGSAERMEYTVLGSEVNLAQRLEASATPGQIMISEKTYARIKQAIDAREIGDIKVKGFERPVKVYEVNLPFEQASS